MKMCRLAVSSVSHSAHSNATGASAIRGGFTRDEASALKPTSSSTHGDVCAVTNIEFRREGEPRAGRQSQARVKMADGWRVVSAHVSWMDA
jgi:hypothetical protein